MVTTEPLVTLEFKFFSQRYAVLAPLLASPGSKGVESIEFFDKGDNITSAIWVRAVGTPAQLQSPAGLYREFLKEVATFKEGKLFEKVVVTILRRLSFLAVERLIPPPMRYDFFRAGYMGLSSVTAPLYDNMELEVWRETVIKSAEPGNNGQQTVEREVTPKAVEFKVELTIWQDGFSHIMNPVGAYDTLLELFSNPLNVREELAARTSFSESQGKNTLALSTPLAPHHFWPLITLRSPKDAPDTTWVHLKGYRIVLKDESGNLKPDRTVGEVDVFYTSRLAAMNGLRVTINGTQFISCLVMDGLWHITLNLTREELSAPTGPYADFLNAMEVQIKENQLAAA